MNSRFLRELKARRRLGYIWDYYRLWILAACALLLIFVYFTVNIRKNSRESRLYVIFANTTTDLGSGTAFEKKFETVCGVDSDRETVSFDCGNFFSFGDGRITGNYYYEKTVVLLDSGTADAIVMDSGNLQTLGARGRLIDLRDPRTAALTEKYRNRLLTAVPEEGDLAGEEIPVGIDLSDSVLVTEYEAYGKDCALGISALSEHFDAVEAFLGYVLGETA